MNRQQTRALIKIREMVLRGDLAAGQRVAEAPLAGLLGMSRTPVRQALPVLAREGLLVEHEVRGYVVRGISPAQILDAIDLRGVLEGVAARRVAEQGASRTLLDALHECIAQGDAILADGVVDDAAEERYAEMNERFHQLIVAAAGSVMIEQSLERIGAIAFAAPRAVAFESPSAARSADLIGYAHRQHCCIFTALQRGEGARVEALMREHANPVKESLNLAADARRHPSPSPGLAAVG